MKGLPAVLLLAVVLVATPLAEQSPGQFGSALASTTESRIAVLNKKVVQLIDVGKLAEADAVVTELHAEVDRYIAGAASAATPASDRTGIENGLARVLKSAVDMPPLALSSQPAGAKTVFVAYSLHKGSLMGAGATSVTLRAYQAIGNRIRLADATGRDMDGYTRLSVKELPSPSPGEAWFLASGYLTGANGPNVRMRVYVYRSGKFRTAWMPANEWGDFTVQPTNNGFTVAGDYYRSDRKRRDVYTLSGDGIVLVTPEH